MWGFIASLLFFGSILLTNYFGIVSLVLGLLFLEFVSVKWKKYNTNSSTIFALLLGELCLIGVGATTLGFDVLMLVGVYLLIRYKGDLWFVDNRINNYVYLLFAVSVPVFLVFITLLVDIEWSLLMFASLYLVFLRISDQVIVKRMPLILFIGTQFIALNIFSGLVLIGGGAKILFVMVLMIWAITKWQQGGQQYNVSKIFTREIYGESRKRLYQGLS